MISFQTRIGIECPLEEVFAYVSDPTNLPAWNSAVQSVHPTSTTGMYAMERQLPTGAAMNEVEIVTREQPHEFAIRATDGPTPFTYRYRFIGEHRQTIVQLDAEVDPAGRAGLLSRLARLAVRRGVDDNLATLKVILEEKATPA